MCQHFKCFDVILYKIALRAQFRCNDSFVILKYSVVFNASHCNRTEFNGHILLIFRPFVYFKMLDKNIYFQLRFFLPCICFYWFMWNQPHSSNA